MADPFAVNKQIQFGVESTSGVGVAANKLLPTLTVDLDQSFDTQKVRGSGRRFDALVIPAGTEASSGKLGGGVTYTELPYPLSMAWGAAVITTPAGAVAARKWVWSVPLSGRVNPKSMTIEEGDSDDSERVVYSILSDLGLDFARSANNISGTVVARALEKANSGSWTGMTPTPTAIALVPVLPKAWDVYMDTSSSGLGGTHLTRCYKASIAYGSAFLPFFMMDSSQSSYSGIADSDQVTCMASLSLVKDAVGEALWATARAAKSLYIRLKASGDLIDNFFTTLTGTGTGGTITFTYKGVTSAAITFSSGWSAAAVQAALLAMSTIGAGNVVVSGGPLPGTALVITMTGALATDPSLLTMTTSGITGGTVVNTLTATQIPYSLQIDFAGKIQKPGASDTNQGLRTRQWDFDVVEDIAWGNAMLVTLITSLIAL